MRQAGGHCELDATLSKSCVAAHVLSACARYSGERCFDGLGGGCAVCFDCLIHHDLKRYADVFANADIHCAFDADRFVRGLWRQGDREHEAPCVDD